VQAFDCPQNPIARLTTKVAGEVDNYVHAPPVFGLSSCGRCVYGRELNRQLRCPEHLNVKFAVACDAKQLRNNGLLVARLQETRIRDGQTLVAESLDHIRDAKDSVTRIVLLAASAASNRDSD
jgi:hypothetical protein